MVEVEVRDHDGVHVRPGAALAQARQHPGPAVEQQAAGPLEEVARLGAAGVVPGRRAADHVAASSPHPRPVGTPACQKKTRPLCIGRWAAYSRCGATTTAPTAVASQPRGSSELEEFGGAGELLKPYVPRFQIEWVRESPETAHRAVDGSLAFVDISGFTALTERLARRGKIGAELLRDTLDGVFSRAARRGLRLGRRACSSGAATRCCSSSTAPEHEAAGRARRLGDAAHDRRVGRLGVGSGTVTLRMSIGIATRGDRLLHRRGASTASCWSPGPTATETVTIEAIADAGEIGISHALARLPRPVVRRPAEGAARCCSSRRRTSSASARRTSAASAALDVASCIPIAARDARAARAQRARAPHDHRGVHRPDGHRRAARRLGPEAFAAALDERISSIQEAALRYEVPFNETDIGKGSVKVAADGGRAVDHGARRGADAARCCAR